MQAHAAVPVAAAAAAALDELLQHCPSDWLTQRSETGERLLETLHRQCCEAELAPASGFQDAVATLHSL